ncbi:MAG: outer membrane protein assembly factor BamD [Succinatimonas sp.]|nr:outer membrane protein assembly factor BamD [Succinatimonas sp.]
MLNKFFLSAICACAIAISGCHSDAESVNKDKVPDLSASSLYQTAKASMADSNYSKARQYLEALDTRYPFGEYTDQVQLDLIYVYYKSRETELAEAAVNRYQRINPTSIYADYVAYMKGLIAMQKRGNLIQEFIGLNRAQKDPKAYYEAIKIFSDFMQSYPDSPYVNDARQRILFMKDQLAEREYRIAEYYRERGAYLSSARHCQSIIYSYRDTKWLDKALHLLADDYDKLNLTVPAENTRKVITASFGN